MFGYRVGEVALPVIGAVKSGVKILHWRPSDRLRRPPVQVSLGCNVKRVACPHPCPNDSLTLAGAVLKRAASKTPDADSGVLEEFRSFVRRWVRTNLRPIKADADTSVEAWLSKTKYPKWRKDQLLHKWNQMRDLHEVRGGVKLHFKLKCFMKDETYPEFKHARGINSRSDEFKCAVGPIFKLMEEIVYNVPNFIKHVPVKDRPEYILNMMAGKGNRFASTDHTSFEAAFIREVMEACEFELYEYLTSELPDGSGFMELIREALLGVNHLMYKFCDVEIPATRMSGEMNTSLGNGFANLMIILFLYEKNEKAEPGVCVEGDDGILCSDWFPTVEQFAQLGFNVKMETHEAVEEASFCGLIFDTVDRVNVTDPLEVLATFGWTSQRYARSSERLLGSLLHCKSLSLAHQYPGCPIIQSLAQYGLRNSAILDKRGRKMSAEKFVSGTAFYNENEWYRDRMLEAVRGDVPYRKVPMRTRLLVASKFGISVATQIKWETYLDSLSGVQELVLPGFEEHIPQAWSTYYDLYSRKCPTVSRTLESNVGFPIPVY